MAYVVAERSSVSIGTVIYVLIGVFVAMGRGYFVFTSLSDIISMLLAVFLWPLLFFGVDLHVALGM